MKKQKLFAVGISVLLGLLVLSALWWAATATRINAPANCEAECYSVSITIGWFVGAAAEKVEMNWADNTPPLLYDRFGKIEHKYMHPGVYLVTARYFDANGIQLGATQSIKVTVPVPNSRRH